MLTFKTAQAEFRPNQRLQSSSPSATPELLPLTTLLAIEARSPNSLDNRLPGTETNSTPQSLISFV
jgi:hypothetical protein